MMEQNYGGIWGVPFALGLIGIGAVALPILVGGFAIVFKIIQVLFFTPSTFGLPTWAIFSAIIFILFIMRRR